MKKYKRLLVGLEGNNTDAIIMGHISRIKDSLGVKRIIFVHILKELNRLDNFYAKGQMLSYENIRMRIIQDIERSFKQLNDLDYEIMVKHGNPEIEIPRIIREENIDLLAMGKKPKPGMTHLFSQLLDSAKCSILIIPKISNELNNPELSPIDFLSNSNQAIKMAHYYKRLGLRGKNLSYTTSAYDSQHLRNNMYEVRSSRDNEVKTNYSRSIQPEDIIAKCAIILAKRDSFARKVLNYSLKKGANLIMFGYKGSNQLASFLFAGIAVKLAEVSYKLPVLIDKKRRMKNDALVAFISF